MIKAVRLLVGLVVLISPARVWAHAHLKRSDPAAGARITETPKFIRLWFSERPEIAMTMVTLTDASGKQFTIGGPQSNAADPLEISIALPQSLPDGKYKIAWRTAASDGHPSRGNFAFTVARAPAAAITPSDTSHASASIDRSADSGEAPTHAAATDDDLAASPVNSLARALSFVGFLIAIGATSFRTFVVRRTPSIPLAARARMESGAAALGLGASVVVIVAAIAKIYLESRMMSSEPGMGTMSMSAMAMHTEWGLASLLAIGMAAIAFGGFFAARMAPRVGWAIAAIASLVLAVTPALAGHAAASATHAPLLIFTDFLHVLGGASWLGSLVCVIAVGIPTALNLEEHARWPFVAALVNSFSPVALISAAIVVASGVLASWLHLDAVSALWATTYGQVLLVKLLLVACTLTIGAYNFKKVQPQLSSEQGTARLRRSATLELAFAFLILVVTGFLTGISP